MIWQTKTRTFDLTRRALIMGVVNVTSDSFSDGGQFVEVESACAQARRLAADGAEQEQERRLGFATTGAEED